MTSTHVTLQRAPALPPTHPLKIALTVLHLAVLGTLGWLVISGLFALLGTGLGLVFAAGLGLILLVGLIYAIYGLAWLETARVTGLYRIELTALTFERRREPTFSGWLRALGRQLKSARMWLALANFALGCVLGAFLIPLVQVTVWSIGMLIKPTSSLATWFVGWVLPLENISPLEGRLLGGFLLVLALAMMVGLALLHRVLTLALIGGQAREAALAAEAHESAAQAREFAGQREGAVRAADVERTRIERDLHDGVQPRLVSVGMTLGLAQQQIDSDPEAAKALIAEAHTSTKAAITELRQLARGIHASVLEDRGLDAALSALAGRSHIPVTLDVRMEASAGAISRAAESAVYFVIAECLTNAAKHSRAAECRVVVRVRSTAEADGGGLQTGSTATSTGTLFGATDGASSVALSGTIPPAIGTNAGTSAWVLWARVEDDGVGGAEVQPGGGLDGITNRVLAAGGTIRIDSPIGGPTTLEVSVPCAF